MPKRPAESYTSDDGFVADDSSDPGAGKASKRSKLSSKSESRVTSKESKSPGFSSAAKPNTDENGDEFWELNASGSRRVTLSKFKGKIFVNVREYYETDTGERKPGKKGISLPMDQFAGLVELLPQIEKSLKGKGESIPRPNYGKGHAQVQDSDSDDQQEQKRDKHEASVKAKTERQNFEATSDEDED